MTTLGQRIRELRDQHDLSLRELARSVEVSAAFMSDVELGRRYPTDEILAKIAKKLRTSVEELRVYDSRVPLEELRQIASVNPVYGFALRRMLDRIEENDLSADELLAMFQTRVKKRGSKE
jgi:transcriptional regulator with XRE-family HTH domain